MNIKKSQGFSLLTTILYGTAVFLIADKSFWLGMILFAVATCYYAIAVQARNEERRKAEAPEGQAQKEIKEQAKDGELL